MTSYSSSNAVSDAVARLRGKITSDVMAQIGSVYAFHFKDTGASYTLDLRREVGQGWLEGSPEENRLTPDFEVSLSGEDFARLVFGTLHPMAGMATGRIRLKGNIKEALKLDRLMKR